MISKTTPEFWRRYYALPREIQKLAERGYRIWLANPQHPSIRFKRIQGTFYSVRVRAHYRAWVTSRKGGLHGSGLEATRNTTACFDGLAEAGAKKAPQIPLTSLCRWLASTFPLVPVVPGSRGINQPKRRSFVLSLFVLNGRSDEPGAITANSHGHKQKQTLSRRRREGGRQKNLPARRGDHDPQEPASHQVRPDGDPFVPSRRRSPPVRPDGPRHLSSSPRLRQERPGPRFRHRRRRGRRQGGGC